MADTLIVWTEATAGLCPIASATAGAGSILTGVRKTSQSIPKATPTRSTEPADPMAADSGYPKQ